MKKIFVLLLFLIQVTSYSQTFYNDQLVANSVYTELSFAGKIMAATVNYERDAGHTDYLTFYGKFGAGYWKVNQEDGYTIPITLQTLLFNTPSHLELGFGINLAYENLLSKMNVYPIVNIGYRIQPLSGGLVMRFNAYLSNGPFPGFSVGYAF